MPLFAFITRAYAQSTSKINFTQPNIRFSEIYAKADGKLTIVDFIIDMAQFLTAVTAILAIVLLLYSGLKRITSAGASESVQEAGDIMWAALIGMAIAFGSVMFLSAVNPALINLEPINLKNRKLIIDPKAGVGVKVEVTGAGADGEGTGGGVQIKATGSVPRQDMDKIKAIYGDPADNSKIVKIMFQGKEIQVHEKAKAAFLAWDKAIEDAVKAGKPRYTINTIHGHEDKDNVNHPGVVSLHSFGISIDINPDQNPNGTTQTNIPQYIIDAAIQNGFRWGGNWNGTSDPQHFEFIGEGGFVDPSGNVQRRVLA